MEQTVPEQTGESVAGLLQIECEAGKDQILGPRVRVARSNLAHVLYRRLDQLLLNAETFRGKVG